MIIIQLVRFGAAINASHGQRAESDGGRGGDVEELVFITIQTVHRNRVLICHHGRYDTRNSNDPQAGDKQIWFTHSVSKVRPHRLAS